MTVTGVPVPPPCWQGWVLAGLPSDRFFFRGPSCRRRLPRAAQGVTCLPLCPAAGGFRNRRRTTRRNAGRCPPPCWARARAAVARELTKLHEEVRRGSLPALAAYYMGAGPPRGEIVLLIGPEPAPHRRRRAAM